MKKLLLFLISTTAFGWIGPFNGATSPIFAKYGIGPFPGNPTTGGTGCAGSGGTPCTVPGLTLWYDLSDSTAVTVVGGKVALLRDKSILANNATQATAVNQFNYSASCINGNPCMASPADDQTSIYMNMVSTAAYLPITMIFVIQALQSIKDDSTMFSDSHGNTNYWLWPQLDYTSENGTRTVYYVQDYQGNGFYLNSTVPNVTTPYMAAVTMAADSTTTFYQDLTGYAPTSHAYPYSATDMSSVTVLGSNGGNFPAFYGYIGEILIYNTVLTTPQLTTIYNYLNAKWGGI